MATSLRALSLAACLLALASPPAVAQSATAELFASGLSEPLDLQTPPGDARLFVVQQTGQVRVIDNGGVLATPYFDVSALIEHSTYTGLRSIVFHPHYAQNGYVYLWYDEQSAGHPDVVLERMTVSATDPNVADPSTRVEILRIAQPQEWHGGGCMAFGADGFLYCAMGDGFGFGGDPSCNAQNGQLLLGKILRLDVDSAFPYAIPAGNPFVGDASVRDEIWHIGLRHPWRWSFDRDTGEMYIGDVGQSGREEIDVAPAGLGGLNFGWKIMEGTLCNNTTGCAGVPACNSPSLTMPIHDYPLAGGNCSVTGGFVYRGSAIPSLFGHYVFADWCSGRVWSLRYSGGSVFDFQERTAEFGGPFPELTSFGEDDSGELYFALGTGQIYQLRPGCGAVNYCTGVANSTGQGATINMGGSASVATNNFSLVSSGAVPNQFGLFFYGPNQISVSFGDGLRCVGGTTYRLNPPQQPDFFGDVARPVDFTLPPTNAGGGQIAGGSVWNFQYWYRDPAGAGSGFNLSNAVSVTFCP
jgi:glucose/arabinose dehydrogenase